MHTASKTFWHFWLMSVLSLTVVHPDLSPAKRTAGSLQLATGDPPPEHKIPVSTPNHTADLSHATGTDKPSQPLTDLLQLMVRTRQWVPGPGMISLNLTSEAKHESAASPGSTAQNSGSSALCVVAKDENHYLVEWVRYHRCLGEVLNLCWQREVLHCFQFLCQALT